MSTTWIRDAKGNPIGHTVQHGDTTLYRDAKGNPTGRVTGDRAYDAKGNYLGGAAMIGTQIGKR